MRSFSTIAFGIFLYFFTLNALAVTAAESENAKAEYLFEQFFAEQVSLSPMYQAQLGRKTHYGEWDDISPAADELARRLTADQLRRLQQLDASLLNPANQLNLTLLQRDLQQQLDHYQWRDYNYPVNQMFGLHAGVVSFLINTHRIDTISDARAYISRLEGIEPLFAQLISNLMRRAENGIIAPEFVYPYVISDSENILHGKPFSDNGESPLWRDFTGKLETLKLPQEEKSQLLEDARNALLSRVQPAYNRLIQALQQLHSQADQRSGAWKFPQGQDFYNDKLKAVTTTALTAPQIHQLGLQEVARIQTDMRKLLRELDYDGSLAAFFSELKSDNRFYYPDSQSGRDQYLADTRAIIHSIQSKLPELFGHIPQAELKVKAVEAFREKSAGKAFYQSPAEDGSRPGIYYVNLHDLAAMPKYQMEALAYHEALPGHHMQIAIAQELDQLPEFRRHSHYTAYVEGWGLYAERVPKELGFYSDPYSDFGRLSFELWRSIRLVVDTGIHHYRWSREQAIDYFLKNSPMTRADATREVERYIVMPGQATAYKVGMEKILSLRARAQQALGNRFELKQFHDVVLGGGALPLDVLRQRVEQWVRSVNDAANSPRN
ncbi:DUF885 family protein [Gilvimarinus sp. DA14]|uniref:DUF885 domain-containing protein n=1 Tax=Gilvimarinus sp. DA14 TaxID=2956798 RepID=UPI0020B6B9C2|nr:DUF885 domain-containing protein [Gilvimarinus sp. DA14]UTF58812.1 DUF885 domain-containing protein [Gilvimarinus sp. DA14]